MTPITFGHAAAPVRKSAPGTFATGKGTTQRIIDRFAACNSGNVSEIAEDLNLPSRQLSKRLAELVKREVLVKAGEWNGSTDYKRGPKFPTKDEA